MMPDANQFAEALGGPLAEHLATKIPRAAMSRHRRFHLVPAEDFEQVMWERVLRNPAKYRRLLEDGKHATIWLELLHVGTKLGKEDERYRRAQKALVSGYRPSDEAFYTTGMLGLLIPVLIEAEWEPAAAVERASQQTDAAGVHIGTDDPAAAGEYQVMLIDVAAAFRRLNNGQQRTLTSYYSVSQEDTSDGQWQRTSLAGSMGLTLPALRQRVHRALYRLQEELGGASPYKNATDAEEAS